MKDYYEILNLDKNADQKYPFTQVPIASPLIRIRLGDVLKSNYTKHAIEKVHGLGTGLDAADTDEEYISSGDDSNITYNPRYKAGVKCYLLPGTYKNNKGELVEFKDLKEVEIVIFMPCGFDINRTKEEILNSDIIDVIKSNRGGKTTYHGPGQRIVYFMLNLNNKSKDIRRFITIIENSLISFLSHYNVEAQAFKDRVGIWVTKSNNISFDKEKKIGAIGLRIKKWITYHGLSFNINPDLKYYNYIHSCGLKEYKNTSMEELGIKLEQSEFDNKFKKIFLEKLKTI